MMIGDIVLGLENLKIVFIEDFIDVNGRNVFLSYIVFLLKIIEEVYFLLFDVWG